MRGARETSRTLRPFMFAPLVLTGQSICNSMNPRRCLDSYALCCAPDDDALLDSSVNEDLGIIQIDMTLVKRYDELKKKSSTVHIVPAIGPVHERSKKAGVHAVA